MDGSAAEGCDAVRDVLAVGPVRGAALGFFVPVAGIEEVAEMFHAGRRACQHSGPLPL